MKTKLYPNDLIEKKQKGEKITVLTAYDALMGQWLDAADIDVALVGDSLGNVVAGHATTLPVTLDQMVYHTQAVARGCQKALIVSDMPYLTYHISLEETKYNAGRLMQEGGAQAVKLEITHLDQIASVSALVNMGIPVMGHVGFTPQSVHQLGGYKVQGKSEEDQKRHLELCIKLEQAGCFGIVLEMVPSQLAQHITQALRIPTIGIGAGIYCDGQVLVTHDVLGLSPKAPKFVKPFAQLQSTIHTALTAFKNDVVNGQFPDKEHSF